MGVSFARVSLEGKTYTSATTAPTLPANLSAAVLGVNGLQPHIRPHKHLIVKPNSLTGTNAPYLPSQIAKAYSAYALYSSGITGAGQSIAIVIDTFPAQSDLTSFWHTYGVNQSLSNITFIQVVSGTLPTTSEGGNTRHGMEQFHRAGRQGARLCDACPSTAPTSTKATSRSSPMRRPTHNWAFIRCR